MMPKVPMSGERNRDPILRRSPRLFKKTLLRSFRRRRCVVLGKLVHPAVVTISAPSVWFVQADRVPQKVRNPLLRRLIVGHA